MPRLLPPPLTALLLALALGAAGCGTGGDAASPAAPSATAPSASSPPASADSSPDASPSATAAADPGATASVVPLDPGAAGGANGRLAPADHLIDVAALPALSPGATWTETGTGPEDLAVVGACQKTDLLSIGAVRAVRRTFTDSGGASATQVVATFVDRLSAWQAAEVLTAWHDDCATRVGAVVSPLLDVPVRAGTAQHYRTSLGDSAATVGVLRKGATLTLVEVAGPASATSSARPATWSAARVALRRIARTFA